MFSVASHEDESTKNIEYSSIPKDWIFFSNNKMYFHYPPAIVQGKRLFKMVKEVAVPADGWRKFCIRKIHYNNIKTLEQAEKLVKQAEKESSAAEKSPAPFTKRKRIRNSKYNSPSSSSFSDSDEDLRRSMKKKKIKRKKSSASHHLARSRSSSVSSSRSLTHSPNRNGNVSPLKMCPSRESSPLNIHSTSRRSSNDVMEYSVIDSSGVTLETVNRKIDIMHKILLTMSTMMSETPTSSHSFHEAIFDGFSELPLPNLKALREFEEKTKAKVFKKEVMKYLFSVEGDTVKNLTYTLVSCLLSERLALQCCISKEDGVKIHIGNTILVQIIKSVVAHHFKKYVGSKRVLFNPDPVKVHTLIGNKLRAWSYTLSQNIKKRPLVQDAKSELLSLIEKPDGTDDVDDGNIANVNALDGLSNGQVHLSGGNI